MGILLAAFMSCGDKTCNNHSATVHIEKTENGYDLIRNGKPFYIIGGAAKANFLEELKDAGANTARIYDTLYLKRTLDKAQSLDLAVVVDIPLPKFTHTPEFYEDKESFTEVKKKIGATIARYKDHPALLYWNLGNELYYPYLHKSTDFFSNFNQLIDTVHAIDPNHLVSTTTIGANKSRVLSIITKSPQLDFISFNSFGVLSQFSEKLSAISPVWDGPYVITEWGVNGPWEAVNTSWKAPIEETSSKKAEQIRDRHYKYIEPMKHRGSFGSFVFYWGAKNEVTPTWYSLFGKDKIKSQAVFHLENIWKNETKDFKGPVLDYILLNNRGAAESIVLTPETQASASVKLPDHVDQQLIYHWEIRGESWHDTALSEVEKGIDFQIKDNVVSFNTPKKEGPYRLFLYLTNQTEYYATANIPFYVLNPDNEE